MDPHSLDPATMNVSSDPTLGRFESAKSGAPRKGKTRRRRRPNAVEAARIYGALAPVSFVLNRCKTADNWVYVQRGEDAWWIDGEMSVNELLVRTIQGDFWVHDRPARKTRRRRG